jgi:uncharacterized protein YbaP (TraB family)
MLWKIDNTPHRVLGSVHVLPEDAVLPRWAAESHIGMERFVFESDFRDPSAASVGVDTSGAHLAMPGAAELYARAAAFLAANSVVDPFDGLRPWRAAFYMVARLLPAAGLSHEHGMDNRLRLHADREQLPARFLESPTRAFDLLDSSCKEAMGGLRFFEHALTHAISGSGLAELQRIIRAWFASDLPALTVIYREKLAEFPELFGPLITQRNREWIDTARPMIADRTTTLFVVSALHTVGPDSFIERLESEGFSLTKIS